MDKKISRSELKRAAIIRAAMSEFQAKGFKATSMDDVAKCAEVSKRTVYNHFPSKEVLFSAITLEMMALLCTFEYFSFSNDISVEEQLRKLVDIEIEHLRSQAFIDMARVIIAEAVHSPELIQGAMKEFSKQETPLNTWFQSAMDTGALNCKNTEIIVTQFVGVIKAFCFWPQMVQGAEFPSDEEIVRIKQTVVKMILKQYT
ncbi:TetR/AcrR family transcriptional regulator [Shewanella sp. D64]|uniref:TetR/AcrR family transcriptional regulator n=1 Tax=unclassified Shewanella TaxID=196818 RepID=UPI0022BA609E|nr:MULTISPECIES: TetR/AcrR family transcriptional regulator [unclassified Shewanella]MEC4727378.1 TetR/AcrR family transcriptional regulator [Shewanella sp. D64]MEC4739533.1 TetR/AcrR family transcriptional regulator [Shewanella sp. E94]WBJ96083.1 TetR/AcrR family transcriptional regulator [Shewanella sp. MTB7]